MASSLKGTFEGEILAEDFGQGEPTADMPRAYAWGTLAGKGWGCRFSVPVDVIPHGVRALLQAGHDVPVLIRGSVDANSARGGGADFKIKGTSVQHDVESNGHTTPVDFDALASAEA
jgi:hypothetical protein